MSGTSLEHHIHMANQISRNFNYEKSDDKAVAAIADHIGRFWSPWMKEQIFGYLRTDGAELEPRARQALTLLASKTPA